MAIDEDVEECLREICCYERAVVMKMNFEVAAGSSFIPRAFGHSVRSDPTMQGSQTKIVNNGDSESRSKQTHEA